MGNKSQMERQQQFRSMGEIGERFAAKQAAAKTEPKAKPEAWPSHNWSVTLTTIGMSAFLVVMAALALRGMLGH